MNSTGSISINKNMMQLFVLVMACTTIWAITNILGAQLTGRIYYVLTPAIIIWLYKKHYTIPRVCKIYSITLLLVVFFQLSLKTEIESSIHWTVFVRITPVLLLAAFIHQSRPLKTIMLFGIVFYFLECGISVYERMTLSHIINYQNIDDTQATSSLMLESSEFRSYSLMFHPLFNANVISIFMAFILCSKYLNATFKYSLLLLGIMAIWGTNSRGCMIIWAIILIYRFCFYNAKLLPTILSLFLLYILLPIIAEWLLASGILGRFGNFDFSDSSTLTRLEAFDVFFNYEWNIQDILVGGRLLIYPDRVLDIGLENGFLLDLGFWGIIGGLIKSISEIAITYFALKRYELKDKLIFMLAIWGVAFMNNNSFSTFIMPMFVIAYITSFSIENIKHKHLVHSR